jgi:F0F1-type ATP synthase assembly protein I
VGRPLGKRNEDYKGWFAAPCYTAAMDDDKSREGAPASPASDSNGKKQSSGWAQAAKYSQAALTLPASVLAGILIGAALDKWLHKQWITVAGLIVGSVAGFVELIRVIMKASAAEDGS